MASSHTDFPITIKSLKILHYPHVSLGLGLMVEYLQSGCKLWGPSSDNWDFGRGMDVSHWRFLLTVSVIKREERKPHLLVFADCVLAAQTHCTVGCHNSKVTLLARHLIKKDSDRGRLSLLV